MNTPGIKGHCPPSLQPVPPLRKKPASPFCPPRNAIPQVRYSTGCENREQTRMNGRLPAPAAPGSPVFYPCAERANPQANPYPMPHTNLGANEAATRTLPPWQTPRSPTSPDHPRIYGRQTRLDSVPRSPLSKCHELRPDVGSPRHRRKPDNLYRMACLYRLFSSSQDLHAICT